MIDVDDRDWITLPRPVRGTEWVAPETYAAIWPDRNGSDSEWYGC